MKPGNTHSIYHAKNVGGPLFNPTQRHLAHDPVTFIVTMNSFNWIGIVPMIPMSPRSSVGKAMDSRTICLTFETRSCS